MLSRLLRAEDSIRNLTASNSSPDTPPAVPGSPEARQARLVPCAILESTSSATWRASNSRIGRKDMHRKKGHALQG
jgi:hypothetical protein